MKAGFFCPYFMYDEQYISKHNSRVIGQIKNTSDQGGEKMSNNKSGVLVPESKQAMDAFKMEVANSLNVNLKQGYNGDITAKEAGSVGGEMVKRMIQYAENNMK